MDLSGLLSSIYEAAVIIDAGRKGIATRGQAEEGRILYETGISEALAAFKKAQTTADTETIILAEYTFISQELEICPKADKNAINSLTKAVQSFDDAFLVLHVIEKNLSYKDIDKAFPHDKKYRYKNFPKDSYHIACASHIIRIKNILSSPGIDPIEKALLEQRLANLSTAQNGYTEKQKIALTN